MMKTRVFFLNYQRGKKNRVVWGARQKYFCRLYKNTGTKQPKVLIVNKTVPVFQNFCFASI